MADSDDSSDVILIVTGSTLRAEQMDRALAYYLQTQIEKRDQDEVLAALVISDARYLFEEKLQRMPTISVGGPGVNMLAQKWLDELPSVMRMDDRFLVDMDLENAPPRASIWGMNNPLTKVAVVTFAEQFLPRFLQACCSRRVEGEP